MNLANSAPKNLCLIIDSIDDKTIDATREFVRKRGIEKLQILTSSDYGSARRKLLAKIRDSICSGENLKFDELDLIIKVGERSLEGTLTLEAGYAEIVFVDRDPSEFSVRDLEIAIQDFYSRKRNFGA